MMPARFNMRETLLAGFDAETVPTRIGLALVVDSR